MFKSLTHYGTPRHSGRYPWGSGDDPEQRNKSFLGYVDNLKKNGLSEVEIARGLGLTTSQLRAKKSIAKAEQRKADVAQAIRLKDKGMSNIAIGERMNLNESSVRALLNETIQERSEVTKVTSDMLKEQVNKKDYIDVGVGVERHIGISRTKLKTSLEMLKNEGYTVHYIPVEQLGTGKKTTVMVLAKPNISFTEVYKNKGNIKMITDYTEDGGRSYLGLEPIKSVNSNRVHIRYIEDGGSDKDGVIELRRGVQELSLGNSKYAQVRIGVDGKYYMKGMAIYADKLPNGVDIIYNTNKTKDIPKEKVFKSMKTDLEGNVESDNPFGSTVRQKHYIDSKGDKQLSALNIVLEEGEWGKWSKTISSQIMSKQSPFLAKRQLDIVYNAKKEEYDEIMSLTNPGVKKKLLESFASDCDSEAVHLKAAALPRQAYHVILPIPEMKKNEIYAPNYRDGEKVVLIRSPHGGTFEIPQLTVNNKSNIAKRIMGGAIDGVGIHPKVAEQLSGADFDGDTVIVIPNNKGLIKTSSPLKGLVGFDPKISYKGYEGMKVISPRTKQLEMGNVSNLITDMTIKGANTNEIARAVRHSMVVIDAEKHKLNYKQSAIDNGISELKAKYQGSSRSGASTLISRSSSDQRVGIRKESIDPKTGKKIYEYTNETYVDSKGKTILRTTSSTKMLEVDNAFKLSSGTPMETIYGSHANKLKALANQSRKEYLKVNYTPYSPSAKKVYQEDVSSLNAKLNIALKNKPLERQAQILANTVVSAKKANNPDLKAEDIKKIKGQALAEARSRVKAKKELINITPKEWEAIQSGAISANTLKQILDNTDLDKVKQLATPRTTTSLTPAKIAKAKNLISNGYTRSEVADVLGVSTSTISKLIA